MKNKTVKTLKGQKMQEVDFRDVDEFLEFLPDDERKITLALRNIIFSCIPEIKEKLSFNVPFYSYNKSICFIWPASVLWGKKKTYEGVRLGFAKGYLLTDESKYLEKGKRKQIYWRDIQSTKDIQPEIVRALLYEALFIDIGK